MAEQTFEEWVDQGIQALQSDNYEEALNCAKQLQKMEPETADGYHLEGLVYQYQFDWDKSVEVLNTAIECAPYDADLFNIRGFAYMSQSDFKRARRDFEEAIDLEDLEAAHRNIVLLHVLQDDSEEGIEYLVNRLQDNPDDVDNWVFMGDLMHKAGMEEKAETYYQQARKIDPDHPAVAKLDT